MSGQVLNSLQTWLLLQKRKIVVAHAGQQLKAMPLEKVIAFLNQGHLSEKDHFWYEGIEKWHPIADLAELARVHGLAADEGLPPLRPEDLPRRIPTQLGITPSAALAATPTRDPVGAIFRYVAAVVWFLVGSLTLSSLVGTGAGSAYLMGILVLSPCCYLIYSARRCLARSAYSVVRRDLRKPILFLRSFSSDGHRLESGLIPYKKVATKESGLADVLQQLGPIIAIGRPGDGTAEFGAGRIYLAEQAWKEVALLLMKECRCVVLQGGHSEGLLWEMRALRENVHPRKLAIILPKKEVRGLAGVTESPLQEALLYELFRAQVKDSMDVALPAGYSDARFVVFGPDWKPEMIALPDQLPYGRPARASAFERLAQPADLVAYFRKVTPPCIAMTRP